MRFARRAAAGAAVLALALMLPGGAARGQIADDAPVSTEGTQFVAPTEPSPPRPEPPQRPPPPEPPQPAPARPPEARVEEPPPERPLPVPDVVFLLDTSDSMLNREPGADARRLEQAQRALIRVVRNMPPQAGVQLWTFNTHMRPVRIGDRPAGRFLRVGEGGVREALMARIAGIRTAGGTNLYRSVTQALELFARGGELAAYRSGRRYPVLVIVSDGEDGGKTPETLQTVLEARQAHPLVHVTAIGFHIARNEQWFRQLCRIASRDDGCAVAGDEAQLERLLDTFYRPPPQAGGG